MTDAPQPALKKRRPWLAALLSLFWPGLGQLYNGDGRRAVVFLSIELAVYARGNIGGNIQPLQPVP